jgi:hypothetical protein
LALQPTLDFSLPSDFLPSCSFFTFAILHITYKFLFFPSCVLHGLLVIVDFIMLPLLLINPSLVGTYFQKHILSYWFFRLF